MDTSSLFKQLPFSAPDAWAELLPASCPPPSDVVHSASLENTPHQEDSTPNDDDDDWNKILDGQPASHYKWSAWMSDLMKKHGKKWFGRFFAWYIAKVRRRCPPTRKVDTSNAGFCANLKTLEWHAENPQLEDVKHRLGRGRRDDMTAPDFMLGQYNGHSLGLVLDGYVLDVPPVDLETYDLLGVECAHLKMLVGLRVQDPAMDDLCLLILGPVYKSTPSKNASTTSEPGSGTLGEDLNWVDTQYVLAINTASTAPVQIFLVYRYDDYDNEDDDDTDDGATRHEQPELESPPKFCDGPIAFTVAYWERPDRSAILEYSNHTFLRDTDLHVMSTKKPRLADAGYKDDKHPFFPVFLPRDSHSNTCSPSSSSLELFAPAKVL